MNVFKPKKRQLGYTKNTKTWFQLVNNNNNNKYQGTTLEDGTHRRLSKPVSGEYAQCYL